ncbi:9041_t:CDS:2, partial [Gigaspora rosea]
PGQKHRKNVPSKTSSRISVQRAFGHKLISLNKTAFLFVYAVILIEHMTYDLNW